ncbi:PREDICTED: uncharacterized protein LOC109234680 [Nicotiana attenuata]|uniref:uncharacterized protein LOC109234680 n=1 Tax=Nicotiana attenuata TaxID=49451 RepID=UPI00090497D5|nr:PREDICTED: uncharacterized protein LOC109234680 [Nicotiana attenuata]
MGIIDNILFSHELFKGYNRKGISPKCVLKVDIRKVYDSLDWQFLRCMLADLGFPKKFIHWVMECVTTVSYSLVLNGGLTKPFQAKRGIRFSDASGLQANADKSSIYIAGVHKELKDSLKSLTGYTEGSIPFKYLGVPLSAKKLNNQQCLPLMEKITERVNCWSAKMLSYSGRVQLIKSVIFGMQTYWAQIFILPKKIMKLIETICRTYLWTGTSATSRKALIVWDKRLATVDRLQKFGIQVPLDCAFCARSIETFSHLFFDCSYTSIVWKRILNRLGHNRRIGSWRTEIEWVSTLAQRKAGMAVITTYTYKGDKRANGSQHCKA